MLRKVGVLVFGIAGFLAAGSVVGANSNKTSPKVEVPTNMVRVNQLGFHPDSRKVGIVPASKAKKFSIVNQQGDTVYSARLSKLKHWPYADEDVKQADFSKLMQPGKYRVIVEGAEPSFEFVIGSQVYHKGVMAALKAFYFNRASTEIKWPHGSRWARRAGHPDEEVYVHKSAASAARPEGFKLSSPRGWYDAGDFNKYIVNSGIATFTLLSAYEQFTDYFLNTKVDIPESDNDLPDILDEALWNLQWMLSMQDPNDGGVYHKLTTLNFTDTIMPSQGDAKRYVVQKSTAAALNFSAVMAVAGRVFKPFRPKLSEEFKAASLRAWAWAKTNDRVSYVQPKDVQTGTYSHKGYRDEFAWAAAEIAITLNSADFYKSFKQYDSYAVVPSWTTTNALGHISLLVHSKKSEGGALSFIDRKKVLSKFLSLAKNLQKYQSKKSAYSIVQGQDAGDFTWGSNGVAMNQSMVLLVAYTQTNKEIYKAAAQSNVDYIFGRNPLAISYVTGLGLHNPKDIHHRASAADKVADPVPGLLAGGPHSGQQDNCTYLSKLPARSYVDDYCSYSTNEVAINWNAPLVFVLGALEALSTSR